MVKRKEKMFVEICTRINKCTLCGRGLIMINCQTNYSEKNENSIKVCM